MMPVCASPLFRSLAAARSRHDEAEFPTVSRRIRILLQRTSLGLRAKDGVPDNDGALRPSNNWVNLKDNHELAFIGETLAPLARRFPLSRRSPSAPDQRAGETAQENIMAAARCIFRQRQDDKISGNDGAQWRTGLAVTA